MTALRPTSAFASATCPGLGAGLAALALGAAVLPLSGCGAGPPPEQQPLGLLPTAVTSAEPLWIPFVIRAGKSVPADEREHSLGELRQLTFDGTSGSAVWAADGKRLLYQSGRSAKACGQIRSLDLDSGKSTRLSPAEGWAGSAAFGEGSEVVIAFAKQALPPCPPFGPALSWTLPDADIYTLQPDGQLEVLLKSPAYDAEVSVDAAAAQLVFTSLRDGDPELYAAAIDGTGTRRITQSAGYDGGATFSPDSTKLVWHAERVAKEDLAAYKEQLAGGLIKPKSLQIFLAGAAGQQPVAVVSNGQLNFGPAFLPDSRRVIFASDLDDASAGDEPRNFELYTVDPAAPATAAGGPALTRVTYFDGFDGSPRFSPDGRYLVFTSGRHADRPGDTNLFVARWAE